MYRPHPFSWAPAAGQRHATTDQRPAGGWPDGAEITALCDRHVRPESGELAWLWPTCPECNKAAHVLAGIPMPFPRNQGRGADELRGRRGK
ncbi:zinc finger protein [Saccharopolyspora sp. ASAGF58]|uniref:zinc finger protein n=1 Tax=Saccharopolyspora sp. ASAGF58 TaxID=2719023 RepID=UPI001446526A|nr:zinc finger protein [Saccharopolyspora sp. ASAGF58]